MFVVVPDHPGELARLFADVGEIGVNVEDVRIDHDPGRPVGLVELTVAADCGRAPAGGARGARVDRAPLAHGRIGGCAPHPSGRCPCGRLGGWGRDVSSSVVVAVDGTSGSGKSSTCRGVAARLGLRYLDTGAQFRAMTWWMLRAGRRRPRRGRRRGALRGAGHRVGHRPAAPTIAVDGVDVSGPIRSAEVTAAVSPVSTVPEVRARLLSCSASLIGDGGIVVEGRDIGSVVWPEAEVKVYLTADPAARARRRIAEHAHLGDVSTRRGRAAGAATRSTRDAAPRP